MFTTTNNTKANFSNYTQLPPSTNEEWDRPTMITATAQETVEERLCLITASANEFVFVIR